MLFAQSLSLSPSFLPPCSFALTCFQLWSILQHGRKYATLFEAHQTAVNSCLRCSCASPTCACSCCCCSCYDIMRIECSLLDSTCKQSPARIASTTKHFEMSVNTHAHTDTPTHPKNTYALTSIHARMLQVKAEHKQFMEFIKLA